MNETTNAISSRVTRLNSIILNNTETLQKTQKEIHEGLNREALLDSLFVLYHECNKDAIKKKSKNISDFVNKYRTIIKETKNLRVNLADFEIKKLIGSGYFGDVHLVTERHTNDVYAMKKIKKSMVNSFQVKEERDIMVYGRKSDWLTTLQYSFQDNDHLYLIMEFLPGGDLLSLMIRNGAFDEPLAKFYLAEMTLALNALHRLGYVHRDIKPENILLDRFGHLKLADFGSSISLNEDGCFTNISPVGTPDYIAPELLQILSTKGTQIPQKLGTSCDFWSMGVIGYEMITEKTPFHSDNLFDTYNEIQNYSDDKRLVRPLEFPAHVRISRNFRDLLNSLITKPSLRLNYDEIIEHPFFHGITWHNLREQSPPIIPTLSGEDDTSNFEDVDKSLKRSPMLKKNTYTPIRVNEFSGEDLPFLGYTYVYEEITKLSKSKTSEVAIENKLSGKIKDLQLTIKEQMREIKELQKDLLQAERKAAQMISLDKMYHEAKKEVEETKANLKEKISELASSKTEIKTLKSTLKIEEEMRIKNDATISDILSMTYQKWENAKKVSDQHFEKQIDEKKTEISNLLTKIQARDNELSMKIDECDHLQATVEKYKEMLKNAKEQHHTDRTDHEDIRRQLASNFELKIVELKTKLNSENEQKRKLTDDLKELKSQLDNLTREKIELINTKERNEIIIKQLKDQLECKCEEFKKLQEEKREAVEQHFDLMKKFDDLKEDMRTLKEEKKEVRLSKIQTMTLNISSRKSEEMEFRSAHGSLTDLDKIGLAEQQQLRCDLERAKENENIQRKRAENLEEVVGRLEEIIKKFNQTTEQTAGGLLEKRNERLEDQLAEAREQAIIDRQSARTANLSLWKLEKELNDVKHEKTLLQRRLDTATEKIQKFDSEKQCFEMKSKQYTETISSKEKQIEELQKEIRNLKYEMKMDREKWNCADRERLNEKTEIIEGKSKIKSLEEKLSENNRKMSIMEQKFNALLLENENLHHELSEHQQQIASTQENASELENEHDMLKKNYEMLKEACSITESQLNELEEMWNKEVQRNKLNGEKIDELLSHVRSRDEDILKLKKDLAQEKSLKMMAETKGCQLQNESDELKEEMQELQKEMCQMQQKLIEGTQKLYEAQECVEVTNSDLSHLQRLKANYESELSILKEENSRVLTDFYLTKEEVKALNMQLKDAQAEINELIQEKDHLNGLYAELKTHSRERDIKSEATLAQHKKLIEYLQERVEELTQKKKKTLADKIFGGGNTVSTPSTKGLTMRKENINPQDEAELKRVKEELKRERDRSQRLKEDLMRTKIEIRNTKAPTEQIETYNKSPGRHHVERNILQKTSLCESTDVIEGNEQTIQATVHAEPEIKVQDKNEVKRQRESMEPAQHHFSLTIETASPGPNTPAIQCVVCSRIILQGSPYWQCKECKQMVHRKCRGNVKTVCEIYGSSSASSTSSSTATTATLNGSNKNVKKFNLDDVDGIAELLDDNRSEASSDFVMNNYYGDTILSSSKFGLGWTFNTSVTINAVYELGENKILLGCSNGLYSYHVDRDEVVNIKGINSVNYFAIKPNLTKSIIIGDDGENLYECDLRMLSNKSQASGYLEPKLNFQQIDLSIANRCTNTEKWHMVEMHGTSDNLKDARAIAATDCRMVILKYDTKNGRFKPVRALDTAQSISGILFTQHTAILSCDKFFEIDLNTYVAEEFLDMSDQSLRATKTYQPMNVFRINSLEFLLCFRECGVFVDEYGLRSRPDDLKWLNEPQQFIYKNYLLYIIHKESIQIMRINNTYTKHQEDLTTDNNQFRTFVSLTGDRKFTHDCTDQQYCVNVIKTNKIVDGDAEKMSQDLIKIDAEKAFKTHLNRSMTSIISSNSSTSLATLASGSISATSCDTIN